MAKIPCTGAVISNSKNFMRGRSLNTCIFSSGFRGGAGGPRPPLPPATRGKKVHFWKILGKFFHFHGVFGIRARPGPPRVQAPLRSILDPLLILCRQKKLPPAPAIDKHSTRSISMLPPTFDCRGSNPTPNRRHGKQEQLPHVSPDPDGNKTPLKASLLCLS